jgi:hypothetical protein
MLNDLTKKVMSLKNVRVFGEINSEDTHEDGLKIPKIYIDNLMSLSGKYSEIFHEKAIFDEISTIIIAVFKRIWK